MSTIDPTTGQPLPPDAIQRLLFVAAKVHVYQIPPLTSTKGYTAATWTTDPQRHIFTARLRVLETGMDDDDDDDANNNNSHPVKVDVVLEDPASGQLFAAAPYTAADVIEAALDSARFYAVRVQDPQGRKAMLGIGFEERPESFDFAVALQEARKTLGWDAPAGAAGAAGAGAGGGAGKSTGVGSGQADAAAAKRDYSLKEGETITVNLAGSKFGRRANSGASSASDAGTAGLGGFSLPPPPGSAPLSLSSSSTSTSTSTSTSSSSSSSFSLPPPPPPNRRTAARRSVGDPSVLGFDLQKQQQMEELAKQQQQQQQQQQQGAPQKKTAAELGFDDGQFGEFA